VTAPSELLFLVEDAPEGGFVARAVGPSIFTEGDSLDELRQNILEAVECHFEADESPKLIRLHIVHDEVLQP
jgi:predicted RNase H-like HicB family nuclease